MNSIGSQHKRDYEDKDFKAAVVHGLPEAYHLEKTLLKDKYQTMEISEIITVLRERFKELGVNAKEEKAMVAREGNNFCCEPMEYQSNHKLVMYSSDLIL